MEIRLVGTGTPEYAAILELREQVLRRPLGLSLHQEDLSAEKDEYTLAAFEGPELMGCLMLRPLAGGELKLRQMAVYPEFQGRKVGSALVSAAEDFAREKGFGRISLHARDYAIPFYENCAYKIEGAGFEEVGIPHHFMYKILG